eukprot:symbB.v1.2.039652.t1/scaffold6705.1/size16085/1
MVDYDVQVQLGDGEQSTFFYKTEWRVGFFKKALLCHLLGRDLKKNEEKDYQFNVKVSWLTDDNTRGRMKENKDMETCDNRKKVATWCKGSFYTIEEVIVYHQAPTSSSSSSEVETGGYAVASSSADVGGEQPTSLAGSLSRMNGKTVPLFDDLCVGILKLKVVGISDNIIINFSYGKTTQAKEVFEYIDGLNEDIKGSYRIQWNTEEGASYLAPYDCLFSYFLDKEQVMYLVIKIAGGAKKTTIKNSLKKKTESKTTQADAGVFNKAFEASLLANASSTFDIKTAMKEMDIDQLKMMKSELKNVSRSHQLVKIEKMAEHFVHFKAMKCAQEKLETAMVAMKELVVSHVSDNYIGDDGKVNISDLGELIASTIAVKEATGVVPMAGTAPAS